MTKGLQIAQPPQRPAKQVDDKKTVANGEKFNQISQTEKVQFNKRISRSVADGYEIMSIKTNRKVPELLKEALELLEEKYGKI